eukprot:TRINITY_DN7286_c1_g1_i1.p2 TRINITY_DN7286_c1_g1~~TRINITY_DN7286_c1_g1_i1.p2  ORF type:complete len:109 (-),score=19.13 TRINITY_DN7286_c1_g1_i1:188-514(-)
MVKFCWFHAFQKEIQFLTLYESNYKLIEFIGSLLRECQLIVNQLIENIDWLKYNEQLSTDQLPLNQKKLVTILLTYSKINPLNIESIEDFNENCGIQFVKKQKIYINQ